MPLPTPFQTVGPFFALLLPREHHCASLRTTQTPGQSIQVQGTVRDGDDRPVADALIEIWQANTAGRCNHPEDPRTQNRDTTFDGFGRLHSDNDGSFSIETIKPGRILGPGGQLQAPHLLVGLFARGLLTRLITRIYFEDEASNSDDPILACVAPDRRATLIATVLAPGDYHFDVALQGARETVFFNM